MSLLDPRPGGEPPLEPRDFDPDPIVQFQRWYAQAEERGQRQPDAMALATAGADGRPSARFVLLKGADDRGFAFYTNYGSRKGRDLAERPHAALAIHWEVIGRQVRIEGRVEQMSAAESDAYFRTRSIGSRLSAAASPQSRVIADRDEIEGRLIALRNAHPDGDPPRPADWGGYRLVPDAVEFWQQGAHRLHDRLRYRRSDAGWTIERLAP